MTHARCFVFALAVGAQWAGPVVAAEDPQWTATAGGPGAGSMTRTVDTVTLAYERLPGEDDSLLITVRDCGDEPWHMEESLNSVTAETLRDAVKEEFENARLNCKIADGVEERVMHGFDEAFAKVKPILLPHTATVGGWQLADVGSMPGDDSERRLTLTRALDGLKVSYEPGSNEGGGLTFECEGASYGTSFGFDDSPQDHAKVITEQVSEAYADLQKDCTPKPPAQAALMQDFPEALKTLEQWIAAKPFVYPPEAPSSDKEQ